MYTFLIGLQYIGIIVIIIMMLRVMQQRVSRQQQMLLIMYAALLLNFLGGLYEMRATTLQEALIGIQVEYIGKPFVLLVMFLFIVDYCRARIVGNNEEICNKLYHDFSNTYSQVREKVKFDFKKKVKYFLFLHSPKTCCIIVNFMNKYIRKA